MLSGRTILFALTFISSAVGPTGVTIAQTEQFKELWTYGNWKGYIFADSRGFFDRCSAIVQFTDGVTLAFSYEKDAKLYMRVNNSSFAARPDVGSQRLTLRIDGNPALNVDAFRTSATQFRAAIDSPQLFRKLRRGLNLALQGSLSSGQYSLHNSSIALAKMAQCVPRSTQASASAVAQSVPLDPNANAVGLGYFGDTVVDALTD